MSENENIEEPAEDVEGHKIFMRQNEDNVEGHSHRATDDEDVEGHRQRATDDDDVEGHRQR